MVAERFEVDNFIRDSNGGGRCEVSVNGDRD